jgi:hypothetical protein
MWGASIPASAVHPFSLFKPCGGGAGGSVGSGGIKTLSPFTTPVSFLLWVPYSAALHRLSTTNWLALSFRMGEEVERKGERNRRTRPNGELGRAHQKWIGTFTLCCD